MTIGISQNLPTTQIGASGKTRKNFKQKIIDNLSQVKDDIMISKNCFNESLMRKYHREGLFKGYDTFEGSINDKNVYLKIDQQRRSLLENEYKYKGNIGNSEAEIIVSSCFGKNTFSGHVGDKEIDLELNKGLFDKYTITGTIDGKELNIQNGSSIDEAQGENDILTTALSLIGHKFIIKNGTLKTLGLSQQAARGEQEKYLAETMMHNQMVQNQMMQNQMLGMF